MKKTRLDLRIEEAMVQIEEADLELEPCCGGCGNEMSNCSCEQDSEDAWMHDRLRYPDMKRGKASRGDTYY
jgi:hypothetical protein